MDMPFPGSLKSWQTAALLGLVGLGINAIRVPLGWDVGLHLGAAVALLGLRALPPLQGVAGVALVWLGVSVQLGTPVPLAIGCAEAVFLARVCRHRSLVHGALAFWGTLGVPVLIAALTLRGGFGYELAQLIATKHAFNGIVVAALAELLFILAMRSTRLRRLSRQHCLPAGAAPIAVAIAFVSIPAMAGLIFTGHQLVAHAETTMRDSGLRAIRDVSNTAQFWRDRATANLVAFAAVSAKQGLPPALPAPVTELLWESLRVFTRDIAAEGRVDPDCRAPDLLRQMRGVAAAATTLRLGGTPECPAAMYVAARLGPPGTEAFVAGRFREAMVAETVLVAALGSWAAFGDYAATIRDADGRALARSATPGATAVHFPDTGLAPEPPTAAPVLARVWLPRDGRSPDPAMRAVGVVETVPGWTIDIFLPMAAIRQQVIADLTAQLQVLLLCIVAAWLVGEGMMRILDRRLQRLGRVLREAPPQAGRDWDMAMAELGTLQRNIAHAATVLDDERRRAGRYRDRLDALEAMGPLVSYMARREADGTVRVIDIGPSIARLAGHAPEAVCAPGWWEAHVHPEDLRAFRQQNVQMPPPGGAARFTYRLRRADGGYMWVLEMAVHLRRGDERETFYGLLLDISEQKEAERQLLQSAKLAQVGELAISMGHELSQPLNVIKLAVSNLALASENGPLARAQIQPRLERIMRQIDRAAALIGHLKVFGRQDTQPPGPVSVGDAIDGALIMLRPSLSSASIALDAADIPDVTVHSQAVLFEQVIVNLVANAADAIVQCRASAPGHPARIAILVDADPSHVRIRITDTGGGIPEDVLPRIFEPFFTTKPPGKGTGLGLSISARIVAEMGGTIAAENLADGAAFTLRFPRRT